MITLHNPQNTIVFSLDLATEIGDKEAMLLPKVSEWIETGIIHGAPDKKSGKVYTQLLTYNDDGEIWRKIDLESIHNGGFQFMSIATISRKMISLEKQGLIKSRTDLTGPRDSSKFYALDRDGINSLKSLYFTEQQPTSTKIPDKAYSHNENSDYHSENYNIDKDSLKEKDLKDSKTPESKQKNIKDCKEEKDDHLTPGQTDEFSKSQELGKTLLTPDPDDPRPTSLDERDRCRHKLATIMGLDIAIQENKTLVNRMIDKLYPRYREFELMDLETFWRFDWRYQQGTRHPTKEIVYQLIGQSRKWAEDGYPHLDPTKKNERYEDYSDLIET
jgi:DNA-binding PadR family transcriptional regulator